MPPREATIQAMDEVTGPVIGITLVLMAVFLPDGVPGRHHRPALPAVRADHRRDGAHQRDQRADAQAGPVRRLAAAARRSRRTSFFRGFNARLRPRRAAVHLASSAQLVRAAALMMLVFVGADRRRPAGGTTQLPTGFLPNEDQGYVIIGVQLPDAASQERTREVVEQDQRRSSRETPGVDDWFIDRRLLAARRHERVRTRRRSSSSFEPWEERDDAGPDARTRSSASCAAEFGEIQEADRRSSFPPPSIHGLGVAGGFQMQVEDRGGVGLRRRSSRCVAGDRRRRQRRRPGCGALNSHVPRRRAAALRRHRPREGQDAGRAAERRLRHAAGEPRLGLRQRLQQVRPDLPGARAGRADVPRRRRGHPPAGGPQPRRARWCRSARSSTVERRFGPQIDHPLQPVPDGVDHRRGGPGRQLGRGARR